MCNARRAMKIANMPLHAVVVMCRKKSESRTLFRLSNRARNINRKNSRKVTFSLVWVCAEKSLNLVHYFVCQIVHEISIENTAEK